MSERDIDFADPVVYISGIISVCLGYLYIYPQFASQIDLERLTFAFTMGLGVIIVCGLMSFARHLAWFFIGMAGAYVAWEFFTNPNF